MEGSATIPEQLEGRERQCQLIGSSSMKGTFLLITMTVRRMNAKIVQKWVTCEAKSLKSTAEWTQRKLLLLGLGTEVHLRRQATEPWSLELDIPSWNTTKDLTCLIVSVSESEK